MPADRQVCSLKHISLAGFTQFIGVKAGVFVFVVVVFCFLHAFEEELATIRRSLPYSLYQIFERY